jgi:hypothetical protein
MRYQAANAIARHARKRATMTTVAIIMVIAAKATPLARG